MFPSTAAAHLPETSAKRPRAAAATAQYCAKLQEWMWLYYCGQSWQSLAALSSWPFPQTPQQGLDRAAWSCPPHPLGLYPAASPRRAERGSPADPRRARQQDGTQSQAGQEYNIPSPLQRFLAESVDFFILFCVKATIVLWIMHLSGMKDIAKFVTQFVVEEIDESTSMEDLQKMMAVALAYRVCVCVYESICIWGAGGATPGKFLLGLQVVKCDTTTLVRPNRVLVVPASSVSLSASTVRALNKNFSIAFLFPVFITVLFFQHNRPVYDIVAGTIVVQRRGAT